MTDCYRRHEPMPGVHQDVPHLNTQCITPSKENAMSQTPTIGRIVHYTLNEQDAAVINKRRKDAKNLNGAGVTLASQELGPQIHIGNDAREGDTYPAVIVRVWGDQLQSACNLQVLLDGNDVYWATSRSVGEGAGSWCWPPRV